ncbi:MAG: ATP synthase F1 subunit delta [Alphaproteobacteria bacterium]|nr:ATP synthase F1 subunit delta [Alphaproteobacteria bacterium]
MINSELSELAGLSGRYALALFELVQEADSNKNTAHQDVTTLRALLAANPDLQKLIRNPLITAQEQSAALGALLKEAQTTDLLQTFVQFLISRRRLYLLPAILGGYLELLAETRNEVTAYVVSATALAQVQITILTDTLTRVLGKSVRLEAQEDATLLGGFILKVGSRMIDGSLAHQLQSLQTTMNEAR